jgi:hypothetical protein
LLFYPTTISHIIYKIYKEVSIKKLINKYEENSTPTKASETEEINIKNKK